MNTHAAGEREKRERQRENQRDESLVICSKVDLNGKECKCSLSYCVSSPRVSNTHILVRLKTATERESKQEGKREKEREGGDLSSYHIFFSLQFLPKSLLFIISSSHKDEQTLYLYYVSPFLVTKDGPVSVINYLIKLIILACGFFQCNSGLSIIPLLSLMVIFMLSVSERKRTFSPSRGGSALVCCVPRSSELFSTRLNQQ